jgi:hypothetical protein
VSETEHKAVIMNDTEWAAVKSLAKAEFTAELGTRPTRKSVEQNRHDKPFINMVLWFGIITLIVLVVYTSFKNLFATLPFADQFADNLLAGQKVHWLVIAAFQAVSVVLSMVLASPSLIFFKLLAAEDRIVKKVKETKREGWFVKWFDLNYVTPRLPAALTLVIMAWQIWLAWNSIHTFGDVFLLFIPVFAELTLAQLVGDIMQQNVKFYDIVSDVLKEETKRWDAELAGYNTDERYLESLYRHLRAGIFGIVREDERRKRTKPNAWMMQSTNPKIEDFIFSEYIRLTAGQNFRVKAKKLQLDRIAGQPVENTSEPATTHTTAGKRIPNHGDKSWTVASLVRDFELQGLNKEAGHDRGWLDRNYVSGYGARAAWDAGAKDYFTS